MSLAAGPGLQRCLADAEQDKRTAADRAEADARTCLKKDSLGVAITALGCIVLSGPGAPGCAGLFTAGVALVVLDCGSTYADAAVRILEDFEVAKERCERDNP